MTTIARTLSTTNIAGVGGEWTRKLESLLRLWSKQTMLNRILHEKVSNRYKKWYHIIGLPTIILQALSALILTSSIGLDKIPKTVLLVITIVILSLSTMMTAAHNFLSLGKRAERHLNTAVKYSLLNNYITSQLILERSNRDSPREILSNIRKDFRAIVENGPILPKAFESATDLPTIQVTDEILSDSETESASDTDTESETETKDDYSEKSNSQRYVVECVGNQCKMLKHDQK